MIADRQMTNANDGQELVGTFVDLLMTVLQNIQNGPCPNYIVGWYAPAMAELWHD